MKTTFHILRHSLKLKKNNYLQCLLIILFLLIYKFLSNYIFYIEFVKSLVLIMSIGASMLFLYRSPLIPGKTSSNETKSEYAWAYLLSSFYDLKSYLMALLIELFFDSILVSIVIGLATQSIDFFLIAFITLPLVVYEIRGFTIFSNMRALKGRGNSKKEEETKTPKRLLVFFIVIVSIIVMGGDYINNIIPSNLLLYILIPPMSFVFLFSPFFLYRSLITDYNQKENNAFYKKWLSVGALIASAGFVLFYFSEYKTGQIIFSEINEKNNSKVEKMILENKNLLKVKGENTKITPLLYAAKRNNAEIVNFILDHGGDVNERDPIGNNALTYIAANCNLELAESLVKRGIDIHNMPRDNMNPLFDTTKFDCLALMLYFEKLGMEKNALNKKKENYIEHGRNRNERFRRTYDFLKRNNLIQD